MKRYFEKIKLTENPPEAAAERSLRLDKGAAGRFIKAGLVRDILSVLDSHMFE